MKYFEGLTEENAIKTRYKELAKKHHPDLGGSKATMQEINSQYEKVLTGHYQRAGKSITEIEELLAQSEVLRNKLNEILGIEELNVELCGSWIWVTGNTKTYKEKLKDARFMWSQSKLAWYWRAEGRKFRGRSADSLDTIRGNYGSVKLKAKSYSMIN